MESFKLIDTKISSQAQGLTLGGEGRENARNLAFEQQFVWGLSYPLVFYLKNAFKCLLLQQIWRAFYFLIRSLITTEAATAPNTAGK